MVPVIEVHPSPYVVGGQQPMVLMKERHFAVRRGCTATHGFQVGALPCIVADSYQRFLSRNTISQNAGVWCRSESNNEREKERERERGGGGWGWGGVFSVLLPQRGGRINFSRSSDRSRSLR